MKLVVEKKVSVMAAAKEINKVEGPGTVNKHVGGAHGVMVIIVGNEHGDISSNPRWNWLHFT